MKHLLFLLLAFLPFETFAQYLDPFLDDDHRPDATIFIPAPPEKMSGAFYNDFYYYQWGKQQRQDPSAAATAIRDYKESGAEYFEQYFAEAFGCEMSAEKTPEIDVLLKRCVSDAHAANRNAKNHWQRQRPFATFGEPSLTPEDDEKIAPTYSYPSGHTIRCYSAAFALSFVNPDAAEQLLEAARRYAMNRVICGHHYKSDTEAAFQLAVATMLKWQGNDDFQKQLKKARKEFEKNRR